MAKIPVDMVDDTERTNEVASDYMRPKFKIDPKTLVVGVAIVLLVSVCAYMIFDRTRLANKVDKLSQSQQVQQTTPEDEAKRLAAEVAVLIDLPSDETPTVATVTDVSKVKNKPFFAKAQNGDKVLLYAKSSKAVLYRPSTKKLIEVSTLNLSDAQTDEDTQAEQ